MDKSKEVFHHKDYFNCFGVDDLTIEVDCNININSISCLGSTGYYELPQGIQPKTNEAKSYLAGS